MTSAALPVPQDTSVLGAHIRDGGTSFGLWAPRATRVELALVDEDRNQTNHDMSRNDDGVWTVFYPRRRRRAAIRFPRSWPMGPCRRYSVQPCQAARSTRTPARSLAASTTRVRSWTTRGVQLRPGHHGLVRRRAAQCRGARLARRRVRSIGRRPMSETVIYELHVKGYHAAAPVRFQNTSEARTPGLAYPAVMQHLIDLGVTAVELLPVHHFVSEPFLVGRGLSNYWGYNTLGYFAPHCAYGSVGTLGQQVREFKEMVSALHDAGLEVILDVVYNHTGEGGHEGPTLAFRGIDHLGYYRLTDDQRNDYDVTGCGNSVDTSEPGVLAHGARLVALLGHRNGSRRLPLRPGQHLDPGRAASCRSRSPVQAVRSAKTPC